MNAVTSNPSHSTPKSAVRSDRLVPIPLIDREPTFLDLLLTLARRKGTVALMAALGGVLAMAYMILMPRPFSFVTIIEIGSASHQTGAISPIEIPDASIVKLTNAYLPAIERAYDKTNGKPGFVSGIDVKNPRGTALILLSSTGPERDQDEHRTLHRQLAERLLSEHRKQFQLIRANLDLELEQAKRGLAAVKDHAQTLRLRRSLLEEKRTLTNQRLQDLEKELGKMIANREAAGKNLSGQDQVLTLMMIDLQLTREREKRDELQSQLTLGLVEEGERLTRDEADNQRQQQDHEASVAQVQARRANVAETRMIDEPQKSQRSAGIRASAILALGLGLGLLCGCLLAFLREALAVRARQSTLAQGMV
jgi:hypothetical protein